MAIIYSYPTATPKASDLLIGTVTYDGTSGTPVDGNPTRTFNIGDIANLLCSYTLSSQSAGLNANIVLTSNIGNISAVNLLRGAGISISNSNLNGANSITIGNIGVLSIISTNSTFVSSTPVLSSTGNVTISSSLSATGSPSNLNYLRGDNTWSTPVTTITTQDSQFINLTPNSSSNGAVTITAQLSAAGSPSSSNFLRGDNVWAVPAGGGTITSINAGTGIAVDNSNPSDPIVSNTGVLSNIAGTGISISSATGNSTITNTAPDQTVVITGSGGATVTGTYPNFNISTTDNEGVETIVAGTAISVDSTNPASPIINNLLPDQTVVLTEGDNVTIIGTYPNFTISSADSLVDSVNGQTGVVVLNTDNISEGSTNLYDKTVVITGSGGATVTGTYPNFNINTTDEEGVESVTATGIGINVNNTDPANPIISNTLPDQTVVITGSGGATITGTYPSFNIDTTDATGVETLVAGTAISIDSTDAANPIVTNTAPDQTVVITGSGDTTVTGTYPTFDISSDSGVTQILAGNDISI